MKNVMVFSCGAIPAIDINFALRGNNEYKVYGASSYDDHGIYIFENYIGNVPFLSDPDFLEKFNAILEKYSIDFIIPLHEDMILYFQEHKNEIKATTVSSCYDTALLCRYKSKTYEALAGCSFVPKTYTREQVKNYPVFVKKDNDQGARHAYKVNNYEELCVYTESPDMIICEYLPGEEITVDCFTDRHGTLRFVNPRVADRILAGIDVHARRVPCNEEISMIAAQINSRICFRGPWFFQIKKDQNGRYKLLEIASRFAGAFGLTRCMDLNTPLLALQDFDEQEIEINYNDTLIEADKSFIGRYTLPITYETVIVDGVETLLIDGKVDTFFMMFIFQCLNKGKRLIMITEDVYETKNALHRMRISSEMFEFEDAPSFNGTIFISRDDGRRSSVRNKQGTPCFHPSIVEALLDWRG